MLKTRFCSNLLRQKNAVVPDKYLKINGCYKTTVATGNIHPYIISYKYFLNKYIFIY